MLPAQRWNALIVNRHSFSLLGERSRRLALLAALAGLAVLSTGTAWAAAPKKVLVVHSFGNASPPFTTHSIAFETELTERIGEQVDLDEVFLDNARYAESDMEQALVDYLQRRQAKWQPDLVVPIGAPAGVFVAQFRDRLFPRTPILYTGMDRRRLPQDALDRDAAFVGESFDGPGFIEDILQLAPATTNIAVIFGASALERYWAEAFRKDAAQFTNRVGFTWLNDLSLDQMLDRVGKLPPRSFVFLALLLRDATGVSHNADEALRSIHSAANAPINSIFEHQLGLGIVGGRLYSAELAGTESARMAIRILHGEPAVSLPPRFIGPAGYQYDWRELQRWRISQDSLPLGSRIKFRENTAWQRYRVWILAGISVCFVEGLLIFALLGALRQRREAGRALRQSEERMNLAASAADLGMWEWDLTTDKVWVAGRSNERIGPIDGENSDYSRFLRTVHPDDRDEVAQAIAKAMQSGGEYEHVHRRVLSDGRVRWIAARGRVEFGPDRKPLRMRGVGLDITARKEAEDRARESERQFVLIANAAPVLIWTSGPDKLCTFVNQSWLAFTGRTLEEDLGEGWAESIHPDDRTRCLKIYAEAFDARHPFIMEYRLRRHDGRYRWVSDHGVPRYDAQQQFMGYIGSCLDITERKDAEEEAQRARQELAHVSRVSTLGELAGSLAHELNQPLTAIVSNTQAAQRFLDQGNVRNAELREILHDVVQEGRRAGEIITRMRAMLKKDHGPMLPQNLREIVNEVLGLLHSGLLIRQAQVVTRIAGDLPLVTGDRVQLQQVLLNLVMNACDAMNELPASQRRLMIDTRKDADGNVEIIVSDCGPGFSADRLQRVFEPFRTTKRDGLGLGLPICRSIITAHGGRINVGNDNGHGAVVRVTLPAIKQATQ
jgi:PAS domain S-box-containing protein